MNLAFALPNYLWLSAYRPNRLLNYSARPRLAETSHIRAQAALRGESRRGRASNQVARRLCLATLNLGIGQVS